MDENFYITQQTQETVVTSMLIDTFTYDANVYVENNTPIIDTIDRKILSPMTISMLPMKIHNCKSTKLMKILLDSGSSLFLIDFISA